MKNKIGGIALALAVFAASNIFGAAPAPGVAGVTVTVKQSPGKRATTDARGNFVIDALPAGSCTLTFRASPAKETKTSTTSKVTIATSYSIRIEGAKHPVNQSNLTSNKLLSGVDVSVEVGAGGRIQGQVLAGALKKMVWIPPALGSNIPGHWADPDSKEATALNTNRISNDDLRNIQRGIDPKQNVLPSGPGKN